VGPFPWTTNLAIALSYYSSEVSVRVQYGQSVEGIVNEDHLYASPSFNADITGPRRLQADVIIERRNP
jgi:hypothetical protein